jgi:oxepin-CoA hydrolase/3-oxo-5,6-dehydrosuberyl-CoA semialdehyde dehydrogenase
MAQARRFAIERGGKALQAMTFIERSAMLKAVAKHLLEQKESCTPSRRNRRHPRR